MGKNKKINKTKSIVELRNIWNIDKEIFTEKEIGGLQNFVHDMFLCKELFALNEGRESTKIYNRKYEITSETRKEDGKGFADFVIYINGDDIVIPVEVEKFDNIKKGEKQLLKYQTEWRKKYGILTDGNEWRFYFDNVYETFTLEEIFNKRSGFLKKWKLYISPETYYNMTFNPKQPNLIPTERLDPCTAENRKYFFNDITTLLRTFKSKIIAIMPLFKNDRIAIETTYSYIIQFILYKVLIDNNSKILKNDYEKFRNWVIKAIQTGDYGSIIKDIKKISEYIYKKVYEPFREKQKSINKGLIEQLKQSPTLDEIAPWLDIIMFIDRYNFAGIKNELFGFVYENYLKELYNDKNKGQYFTDPAIVNFMLQELGYTASKLKQNPDKISIIDPSCGAGTFIYSATTEIKEAFNKNTAKSSKYIEKLINNNVFGLDMEEFPLFLAEMNILMQLLPIVVNANYSNPINEKLKLFITKDSISEFLGTAINPCGKNGEDINQNILFNGFGINNTPPYMRQREDLQNLFQSLEGELTTRLRFDYVIGNPPYISYNECSKNNILFIKKIQDKNDKSITMGNVYGVNLNTVPGYIKPYPPKPNLFAFFIALGFGLLKNNGKICYIIPQTILTAGDLDVLRYYLSNNVTIEKIITFEANVFIGRGLKQNKPVPTSSLIFVCKKTKPPKDHSVKIINFQSYTDKQGIDIETYLKSNKKKIRYILQSELIKKIKNWNFIKQDSNFISITDQYIMNTLSIEDWRKQVLYDYDEFHFDVGYILDQKYYTNNYNNNVYPFIDFSSAVGYTKMKYSQYYPKDKKKIKLTRNSRYSTLDNKYNIVWRIKNFQKFMLLSDSVIFNMGQASIIATDNKDEALFLFSLLNCPLNIKLLEWNMKSENEKEFLVAIKPIKQYIRIPKITQNNKNIKNEIIKQTESMLDLENLEMKDVVEFKSTSLQLYEDIRIEKNNIILGGEKKYVVKIKSGYKNIVENIINKEYFSKNKVSIEKEVDLEYLRVLPVIDFDKQKQIKDYIDNLVFSLYFNINLNELGINYAENIQKICSKNKFYKIING